MNILFAATPKIALKTLEIIYESKHDLVGVICAEEKRSGRGLKFVKSPIKVFAEEKKLKFFHMTKSKIESSDLPWKNSILIYFLSLLLDISLVKIF